MKVYILFFVFLILVDCAKTLRQNAGTSKKDALKLIRKSRGEMLENLFIVYDPSFLSYVWPKIKNGIHLSISGRCWEDMGILLKDLSEGHAWAYKTADASGRYHSGFFGGNTFWLGSKEQCLQLDDEHNPGDIKDTWGEFYSGDYLSSLAKKEKDFDGNKDAEGWHTQEEQDELMLQLATQENTSPIALSYVALQIQLNITKFALSKSHDINLGLCLPRSCSAEDVVSIINFSIMLNDNLKTNRTIPRNLRVTSLRFVENSYSIKTDIGAVILILISLLLVTLAIIATVVDFDLVNFKPYAKGISFDLEPCNNTSDKRFEEKKKVRVAHEPKMHLEALAMKNYNDLKIMTHKIPPRITQDVVKSDGVGSCARCGKYKKQCPGMRSVDVSATCPRTKYNSCASLTTEYKKKTSAFKSLLLSFSLKHSWMRIFNTSMANKDLSVIHGVKVVATLWIIYIHVAVVVSGIAENSGDINEHNNIYYILTTGTLAFDTLFFASGLFSAHHFFYLKSRYSVEELVNFGGCCGQALQLLCFITNRAIRLLPSYMFVILLAAVLARVSRDTAVLSLPERDFDHCRSHWWRNVLYINNFYDRDEQCMQVSWYLSLETQLHTLGALLCLLLAPARRRAAALLALVLLLAALALDVTTAYTDYDQRFPDAFVAYSLLVNRPWARVAPYFLGVLTAWVLHHLDGGLDVSQITFWCSWAASVLTITASAIVPWVGAGWLASWLHLTWPLALLWPALVCATKYVAVTRKLLQSSVAAGLSRTCYGALLLHGIAARALLLAAGAALCSRGACLWWYFAGTTLLTLGGALALCLLVEMPICSLLRRISDYTDR